MNWEVYVFYWKNGILNLLLIVHTAEEVLAVVKVLHLFTF